MRKSLWGPVTHNGILMLPIYKDLGVGLLQLSVRWDQVAPTRPANPRDPDDRAYRWPTEVDEAVRQARRFGYRVSLLVSGAPRWANGGRDHRWAPRDPRHYADFLEAAAKRWPSVDHWMIWGEPTKPENFQPLARDRGKPLRTTAQLRGPRIYARLLDAAYVRLHSIDSSNRVIGGNSFTTGTVRPLHWIRALSKAMPGGKAPRMDLYGHNPFSLRRPVLSQRPLGRGYADFGDLDTLVRTLDRYIRPRGRKLRLFLSEYTLPTDHANHEFNFFLTPLKQAQWLTDAYRTARTYDRIYSLGYLSLFDDAPRTEGDEVMRGLLRLNFLPKPAYQAYKSAR